MSWHGAPKRRLPGDWSRRVRDTERRAGGRCEWTDGGQRCPERGRECDHIGDRDDHSSSNLQWLCRQHHAKKTAAQGVAERARIRNLRYRPKLKHPGLIED